MNVFEMDHEYVANTYARFPVNIVEGKGSILKDETGKEYIDLGSGIAVNSFGTADEKWIGAVTAQLHAFQHTSNLFYTQPCAQLAQKLCQRTGMKKVFFSNSGAESNETAIKAAREYASLTKGPDCYTIVSLKNSFHGRTLATLAATGQDTFHQHFGPMPQGFVSIDPTTEALEEVVKTTKVAGIMFEAIQGEGGIQPLNPEDMLEAARIDGATNWQTLWKVTIPNMMSSFTICIFLTLTNGFKLFDQNLALTGGRPFLQQADGSVVKTTEMLALNIYNSFYSGSGNNRGVAQAKAVLFFILVAAIGLIQLRATRKKEVQQ